MTRNDFIKTAALAGAASLAMPKFSFGAAKGSDKIKIAIVGCGGRGTGALQNMLAADKNIEIIAAGDLYSERIEDCGNKVRAFAKRRGLKPEASVLGFFIGLARLSDNWLLRKLSTIYIEIFRNIPPLLQIFFWYFAVLRNLPGPRQAVSAFDLAFLSNRGLYIPSPQLGDGFIAFILAVVMAIVLSVGLFRFNKTYQIKTGQLRRTWPIAAVLIIGLPLLAQWLFGAALHWDVPALRGFNFRGGMVLIPELAALTLALSVYTSAFIAEIIRAGIQAVPYGQHEAARSLGLPNPVTLRQVIIPQALRVIIPPLTSQYLNIVKNSSLAAAIGYPDMVSLFAGTVLNQTGQAIETIAMTMSVYLIISLTISLLMNIYNRRIAIVER